MAKKNTRKKPDIKPDPETLNKTDPQEEMKGPVSTPTRQLEKVFDQPEPQKPKKKKDKDA
ncbi:hypothetical protein LL912_08345 [Niabella sp. CC-SYL272]|uniref:hypothetical protein n=1 Tax=Niabella agricola TaxID=2891571 RepID=UPI001F2F1BFD|nr:hypothetical protein [Niabella agricola]MCF3108786.1 hypothetical protein [Niabella agricola]